MRLLAKYAAISPETPGAAIAVARGRTLSTCLALLGFMLISGCTPYSAKLINLKPELASSDFEAALVTVEKQSGSKDRLLYFLERGLILHYADRYVESNEAFAAAERTADELYKSSFSEGAISLLTNDEAISYQGQAFEMAMVPYYKAFNYIYLGQREEALVEARRASLLLSRYIDVTLKGIREEDRAELEMIQNSAFLLYFSGLLYDWDGEINDAFTAYRNAAVAYQQNHGLLEVDIPPSLARDLERTGRRLGFQAELEQVRQSCPDVYAAGPGHELDPRSLVGWKPGHGEVALMLESGFVPHKTQIRFDFPIFSSEAYDDPSYWAWQIWAGLGNVQAMVEGYNVEYWVSVAAPELQDAPGPVGGAVVKVTATGDQTATTLISNLNRESRITFDAEKPTIFFKTIMRGLTKYLASRGAEKAGGQWAKLAVNIFGSVTETANTRSWLTLPENIHLARLSLAPGTYDLEVEILDRQGLPMQSATIEGVIVTAGDWTFLSQRIF